MFSKKTITIELKQISTYFDVIVHCASQFIDKNISINNKLKNLEEDLALTLDSLRAKNSIQNLRAQTVKYAESYYLARLYEVCQVLLCSIKESEQKTQYSITKNATLETLYSTMNEIRQQVPYSLSTNNDFSNPYPQNLFFSQKYHGPQFSLKSGRGYVAGRSIQEMADALVAKVVIPDDLRVNVYFAEFNNQVCLFAYNNRTWATFSRAQVPATRIVPILPTQDLLERIAKLVFVKHDPNVIFQEESDDKICTVSQKPASWFINESGDRASQSPQHRR